MGNEKSDRIAMQCKTQNNRKIEYSAFYCYPSIGKETVNEKLGAMELESIQNRYLDGSNVN